MNDAPRQLDQVDPLDKLREYRRARALDQIRRGKYLWSKNFLK